MGTATIDFSGETVQITGAGGGMGRAIALAFADAGAGLVLVDIDEDGGAETERAARAAGADAVFVRTDVAVAEEVAASVDAALERFGRLDHAVNAAAIENETVPLHECADDDFDRMQRVNLRGVFLCMKHQITAMLAGGGGTIVNVASTNAFRPQSNQPAYTASKHGVLGLTRSAAIDYAAQGVRINAICPGSIDTPMLRDAMARRGRDPAAVVGRLSHLARCGRPEEIAAAALWLSSDASSFTLGHPLAVDAGYLAR
jgi:NAD(P)-dependent dehydrogenase (short-subunit alcohol dehydrogenase family)